MMANLVFKEVISIQRTTLVLTKKEINLVVLRMMASVNIY